MTNLANATFWIDIWRPSLLTSILAAPYWIVACSCLLTLGLGFSLLRRLGLNHPRVTWFTDQGGTATIEFTLVLPFLLFLALTLAQTTLLMGGNLFLHYSAFAATRSAIVQIPRNLAEEPSNVLIHSPGYAKFDTIRRVAVYALTPVAGRLSSGSIEADGYAQALQQLYDAYGHPTPRWVPRQAADRLRYADAFTSIQLLRTTVPQPDLVHHEPISQGSIATFGPKEPITVEVSHRLHLAVPYVGVIFADGMHALDGRRGRYAQVSARYTLTNEGHDDQLPPEPPLPRNP